MGKMSEMQSPRVVNVQSSQQAREAGADSGPTWAVAKQVEKQNHETKMYGSWSRESWQVGDNVQFLLKRKRRKESLCRGLPRPGPFLNGFISFSTFSHSIFSGAFENWLKSHPHFKEGRIKAQRHNMTFPRSLTWKALTGSCAGAA